jgi:hypothetical protein
MTQSELVKRLKEIARETAERRTAAAIFELLDEVGGVLIGPAEPASTERFSLGTVSSGTLQTPDLLVALANELEDRATLVRHELIEDALVYAKLAEADHLNDKWYGYG